MAGGVPGALGAEGLGPSGLPTSPLDLRFQGEGFQDDVRDAQEQPDAVCPSIPPPEHEGTCVAGSKSIIGCVGL
jgi:hypothetical protein